MHVTIEYCVVWNYKPRAASLAARIKADHAGARVDLQPGGRGDFIVTVDGEELWNKRRMGDEFPDEALILASLPA